MEELVKQNDEKGSNDELDDKKETNTGAELLWWSVQSCKNIDGGLAKGNNESKDCNDICKCVPTHNERRLTFLSPTKQSTILLQAEVDVNQVCTSKKLHDHPGCHDGGDSKFHEGSTIRRHNDTHPVKRI